MSKVYRQIPVASEHLKHSVVCVWGPVEGRWIFAILYGLAFGLVLAVVTLNRYPFFIRALARKWIAIPCTNFHDDFKLHTAVHDGGSGSHYLDRLMAKSGLGCKCRCLGVWDDHATSSKWHQMWQRQRRSETSCSQSLKGRRSQLVKRQVNTADSNPSTPSWKEERVARERWPFLNSPVGS